MIEFQTESKSPFIKKCLTCEKMILDSSSICFECHGKKNNLVYKFVPEEPEPIPLTLQFILYFLCVLSPRDYEEMIEKDTRFGLFGFNLREKGW
jgi:hypothetical protein